MAVTFVGVVFILLELLAYGLYPNRSNRFLVPGESKGTAVWVENPFFPYRFFAERAAPSLLPVVARQDPPEGLLRVCLIGDSAAMGSPHPVAGVGRQLELLLQHRYPDRPVEVIHLGLEDGNSHVLREAARDLGRLKPDAVIVLMGNNEVNGPYSPTTYPNRIHPGPRATRGMVLFTRLRLIHLWRAAVNRLLPARADVQAWRRQENATLQGRMAPQDPRLETARQLFRRNLAAILKLAGDASPAVVACTVPVNSRDCAPFSTSHLADEATAQQVRETLRTAAVAENATNQAEAVRLYAEAIRLNPDHAEALFRAARMELQENRPAEAAGLFARARDADALRLRADSRINDIIREVAAEGSASMFDAERLFTDHSPDGMPGRELFLDHIHFTFQANSLLAKGLLDHLEARNALPAQPHGSAPDAETIADELLFHPWGRVAQLDATVKQQLRLPFRRQLTNGETIARLHEEKQRLEASMRAIPAANTAAIMTRHVANRPDDAWLAAWAGWNLLQAGDLEQARSMALAAYRHWPHRADVRALLGLVRALRGQDARDGIAFLHGGRDNGYQDIDLAIAIARELLLHARAAEARPWLDYALSRDSWNSEAIILMAEVVYQLEDRNRAFARLVQEMETNPRRHLPWTAVFLGDVLNRINIKERAVNLLQRAIKRNPDNPLLWEKLASLYTLQGQGDWKIAYRCYTKAEELAPYRYQRYFLWAEAMFQLRQYNRAAVVISRYLAHMPNDPAGQELQARIQAKLPAQPEPIAEPAEERPTRRLPWE